MVQLTEVRITVRHASANLGQTSEAEVSATFKAQKGGADLRAIVAEKFYEVQAALHQALETEPPRRASGETEAEMRREAPPAIPVEDDAVPELSAKEGSSILPTSTDESPAAPESSVKEIPEEPPITPAQKRTIRSLCTSAGIGEEQSRFILEGGYGSKEVDTLNKREAAGLILQLSQKQRQRVLWDKPDTAGPRQDHKAKQEVFSRNGTAS